VALKNGRNQPLLATLGRGYRSLAERFISSRKSQEENEEKMSALLWKPDDWLAV